MLNRSSVITYSPIELSCSELTGEWRCAFRISSKFIRPEMRDGRDTATVGYRPTSSKFSGSALLSFKRHFGYSLPIYPSHYG